MTEEQYINKTELDVILKNIKITLENYGVKYNKIYVIVSILNIKSLKYH